MDRRLSLIDLSGSQCKNKTEKKKDMKIEWNLSIRRREVGLGIKIQMVKRCVLPECIIYAMTLSKTKLI